MTKSKAEGWASGLVFVGWVLLLTTVGLLSVSSPRVTSSELLTVRLGVWSPAFLFLLFAGVRGGGAKRVSGFIGLGFAAFLLQVNGGELTGSDIKIRSDIRVPEVEVDLFFDKLSVMINSGLPLVTALTVMEKDEKHSVMKQVIGTIADSVRKGSTCSEALALYPTVFDQAEVSQIKAGELGGILEVVAKRISDWRVRKKRVQAELQRLKRSLVGSAAADGVAWGVLVFCVVAIVGPLLFRKRVRTTRPREMINWVIPVLCALGVSVAVASGSYRKRLEPALAPAEKSGSLGLAFYKLGMFLDGGVPILHALDLTVKVADSQ